MRGDFCISLVASFTAQNCSVLHINLILVASLTLIESESVRRSKFQIEMTYFPASVCYPLLQLNNAL